MVLLLSAVTVGLVISQFSGTGHNTVTRPIYYTLSRRTKHIQNTLTSE